MHFQLRNQASEAWRPRRVAVVLAITVLAAAGPAIAAPPYIVDDPETVEPGRWEAYVFVSGTHKAGGLTGNGGVEIDYGAAPDLQLTLELPVSYQRSVGSHLGFGDIEAGVEYHFLHQEAGSAIPDVAIFPRISVPLTRNREGSGRPAVTVPLWAQRKLGPWELVGGGGYTFNPGRDNRNYVSGGVAAIREVNEQVTLSGEIYRRGAEDVDGKPFTGLSLGVTYRVTPRWAVAITGGPALQNAREGGRYSFYLALEADF